MSAWRKTMPIVMAATMTAWTAWDRHISVALVVAVDDGARREGEQHPGQVGGGRDDRDQPGS